VGDLPALRVAKGKDGIRPIHADLSRGETKRTASGYCVATFVDSGSAPHIERRWRVPIGTRVTLRVLGFRGNFGTVSGYSEKGYTVKLDGGSTARWVPPNKLTPVA
jgi:hypothetical protein